MTAATLALLMGNWLHADNPQADMYYAIRMHGNPIGYSEFHDALVETDGKAIRRIHTRTFFKIALLGTKRDTLRLSETMLDAQSLAPISYLLTETTNNEVRKIESKFESDRVRTWYYREGEPRGEPKVTELDGEVLLLGGNDFGHWSVICELLHHQREKTLATVDVFLPDANLTQSMVFERGSVQPVEVLDETRSGRVWKLQGAALQLTVDEGTGQLVRMHVSDQDTAIERSRDSIVKTVEKSAAEEVLARHFCESNVTFDDFLNVEMLEASIDVNVIGEGATNSDKVLETAMQHFEGTRSEAEIQGKVTIRTVSYDGRDAPPVPYNRPDISALAAWLEPSSMIESDDRAIVEQARKLAKDAADSWQATLQIGGWVSREIHYKIADSPSATMALEKRVGDCGPHSTLTVAMLRAIGVPSRLVGGVVYTPTFGGSFGQHAWVEVWMGDAGWIAIDPTTGEFDKLSATHIKLFEGMGGVVPKSIEVLAYLPPNRPSESAVTGPAKKMPWQLGTPFKYRYKLADQDLGLETFSVSRPQDETQGYVVRSSLDLKSGQTIVKGTVDMTVADNIRPIDFLRQLDTGGKQVTIDVKFEAGKAKVKISGATELSRDVTVPAGVFCFDNNMIAAFAAICSQLDLKPDADLTIKAFHPSTLQIISLTFGNTAREELEWHGKTVSCLRCEVAPLKNTFWISDTGRLLKVTQGPLVIELEE